MLRSTDIGYNAGVQYSKGSSVRIFNVYIVRQLLVPTLLAIFVISFIILCSTVQREISSLGEDVPIVRISVDDVLKMALFGLPTLVGLVFPIALLIGTTFVFARMGRDGEMIALRASGVPLKRAFLPIILAGAALSVIAFLVLDIGQPWGYQRLMQLVFVELPERISLDTLRTGQMHRFGDRQIYIGERDEDGTLRNLVVMDRRDNQTSEVYYADAAKFTRSGEGQSVTMQNVWHMQSGRGSSSTPLHSASAQIFIPLVDRGPPHRSRRGQSLWTLLTNLWNYEEEYERLQRHPGDDPKALTLTASNVKNHRIEIAERFSFPLMCFAVAMIAAPLGVRTRRGGRSMTFVSSIAVIVGYFVLRKIVEPNMLYSLPMLMFIIQIPNLTLCSIGSLLLWRIDRI